jgi:hypothetical protein
MRCLAGGEAYRYSDEEFVRLPGLTDVTFVDW